MEAIVVYHPDVKIWQTDRTTRAKAKHPVARELLVRKVLLVLNDWVQNKHISQNSDQYNKKISSTCGILI